ncbi:MAG: cell division protein ZapA [Desulfovibrio sp.]|nr:cell division protein ZapA [Desulfovibrio sp.]
MSDKRLPTPFYVLGLDISFKTGTDMDRVKEAAILIEKMYAEQKRKARGKQTKDSLLIYVALGLADELLKMKTWREHVEERLDTLLAKIEKSV